MAAADPNAIDEPPIRHQSSRYLDHLPAFLHEGELGAFLLAFEQVLTGCGDASNPGIEEILDGIPNALAGVHRFFDPGTRSPAQGTANAHHAPPEFLQWLAGWVGLAWRQDLSEEEQRRLLSRAGLHYRRRGTIAGLLEVLSAWTGLEPDAVTVRELDSPHRFVAEVPVAAASFEEMARQRRILEALLDQEKPAHTHYQLRLRIPAFQVAVRSTVGVDTFLGATPGDD